LIKTKSWLPKKILNRIFSKKIVKKIGIRILSLFHIRDNNQGVNDIIDSAKQLLQGTLNIGAKSDFLKHYHERILFNLDTLIN